MTTQFRSKGKGKDRKVYPLKKRNPYGINRELAAKDVQALRNEGKKARLVPDDVRCALPSEYVISTIQAMLGRQRTTKPDVSDFLMKIKSDYPAEIEFTGNDVRGEPVGYRALIAPRME